MRKLCAILGCTFLGLAGFVSKMSGFAFNLAAKAVGNVTNAFVYVFRGTGFNDTEKIEKDIKAQMNTEAEWSNDIDLSKYKKEFAKRCCIYDNYFNRYIYFGYEEDFIKDIIEKKKFDKYYEYYKDISISNRLKGG